MRPFVANVWKEIFDIQRQIGTGVSDVTTVVNGRATGIPSDVALIARNERLFGAGQRIVHEQLTLRNGRGGINFRWMPGMAFAGLVVLGGGRTQFSSARKGHDEIELRGFDE